MAARRQRRRAPPCPRARGPMGPAGGSAAGGSGRRADRGRSRRAAHDGGRAGRGRRRPPGRRESTSRSSPTTRPRWCARSRGSPPSTSPMRRTSSGASSWSRSSWRGSSVHRCSVWSGRRAAASRRSCGPACCPLSRAGCCPTASAGRRCSIRPGEHPMRELSDAVAGLGDRRIVLAVDQFEETFTTCRDEEERAAFIAALVRAAHDPHEQYVVVIAIRADYYGRCAAYPELSSLLAANHVLVRPMQSDELRRAIELPAHRAGLRVEPELTDALVADTEERARRAAPAVHRAARALAAPPRAPPAPRRLRAHGRRARGSGAACRGRVRAARRRTAGPSRAACSCGSPARVPRAPSSADASRSPSSRPATTTRRATLSTARRSAPADDQRRDPWRSRTRRCCASGHACAAGSRRTARACGSTAG